MNDQTTPNQETAINTETPTTEKVKKPKTPKAKKEPKPLNACWCGCGGQTKNKFMPGHDARFHGWAKKAARGQLDLQETLDQLPHDEARAELTKHVELELPKAIAALEAKEAEKTRKAQERDAKKALAKLAKEAAQEAASEAQEDTQNAETAKEPVAA